jgi:acyl-CoA synthetase (AMP-forming)/AMP-acid ligase II
MGLIGKVLQALYLGTPCVLMSPVAFLQRPCRWLQAISRYRATTSGGPNFAYDLCVRKITPEQMAGVDLSSWDVAFVGAEPVRAEVLAKFSAAFRPYGFDPRAFYPCYGMAEATLLVSGGLKAALPVVRSVDGQALEDHRAVPCPSDRPGARSVVGCGRSWGGQAIRIVDPATATACPDGRVGEIWVSGPSVAQGYYNRPEESAQTFQAHLADTGEGPFLRTGDLGFVEDGEVFVTGRLKDVIIIRGRNHYPQDLEATVQESHPALQPGGGAAFAVEVEGEERLVVVQEVQPSFRRGLEAQRVIGDIRQAVARHHELEAYAVFLLNVGGVPRTSSGKVQRRACRAGLLSGDLEVLASAGGPLPANGHG